MADTDTSPDAKPTTGIKIRRTSTEAPKAPSKSQPQGTWVAYKQGESGGFETVRIFSAEIRALRYAIANHAEVLFLNFDADLTDAIAAASKK